VRYPRAVARHRFFFLLAAWLSLPGCSQPARHAEQAADAGQGRAWVTGNNGYAAFFDGVALSRRDYPQKQGSSAYETASIAAARVVLRDGVPFLFTRPGEVFSWSGSWQKLPVRLAAADGPDVQVDEVLLLPDGRWAVYLHARTLLLASHEDLLASRFAVERTPSYLSWVGLIGGKIHGAGWDASGNRRAALRLDGPGVWKTWPLPADQVHGLIRTPGAELAAVVSDGLLVFEREGEAVAPTLRRVVGPGSYLLGVTAGPGPLLRVIGQQAGLVELTGQGPVLWSFSATPVGGFAGPSGLLGVLQGGEVQAGRRGASPRVSEVAGP